MKDLKRHPAHCVRDEQIHLDQASKVWAETCLGSRSVYLNEFGVIGRDYVYQNTNKVLFTPQWGVRSDPEYRN